MFSTTVQVQQPTHGDGNGLHSDTTPTGASPTQQQQQPTETVNRGGSGASVVGLFYKLFEATVGDVHGLAFEKHMTATEHGDPT